MKLESRFIHKEILDILKLIDLNKNIIEEINCNDFKNASFKLCLNGSIRIRFLKNIYFDNNITIETFLSQFINYPLILKVNNIYLISKIYNYKNIQNYIHFYISIANSEILNEFNINLNESNILDIDNIYILSDSLIEQYEININDEFGGSLDINDKNLISKIWGKGSSYIIGCIFKSIMNNDKIVDNNSENTSPIINIKNGNNYLLKDNYYTNYNINENIKISYIQNYINSNYDLIIKLIDIGTISCDNLICNLSLINKYKVDLIIKYLKNNI